MKIDLDYIKKILAIMEEHDFHQIKSLELIKKMGIDIKGESNIQLDKFIKHIRDLCDISCIDCNIDNAGFTYDGTGQNVTMTVTPYRLTIEGHRLLEAMNNTIWNKIKSSVKEVTQDSLSKIPSLAISLLLNQ